VANGANDRAAARGIPSCELRSPISAKWVRVETQHDGGRPLLPRRRPVTPERRLVHVEREVEDREAGEGDEVNEHGLMEGASTVPGIR
jgi:hypothetical protein